MSKKKTDDDQQPAIDAELKPMTLASIAGGALETQFQERLHEALDVLRDFRRLTPDSDGTYRCTIRMEVAVTFDSSDGSYSHSARALHPKKPQPLAQDGDAYRRGDELKILPEMVQGDLLE